MLRPSRRRDACRVPVLDADPTVEVACDIVMVSGGLIPMELFEEESGFTRMLDGLRSLGRVVVFDRRGLGLSDPVPGWERTIVDQWVDDLTAVVDVSGARDIVLVAWDGFGISSRYSATHAERVSALALYEPVIVADHVDVDRARAAGERREHGVVEVAAALRGDQLEHAVGGVDDDARR